MTSSPTPSQTEQPKRRPQPEWTPHMWEGCNLYAWLKLLTRNRFSVDWSKIYVAVIVTFVSLYHTLFRAFQQAWYGYRIASTPITHAPIFIIGHWRTGTTLLHELLILDERHNYPNTYQCLDPNHFLLTERFFTRWMRFLMPSRRPMDNMAAGWEHPQEDEFALCMLGEPSPYLTIAFPNRAPQFFEFFGLEKISLRALSSWKRTFLQFLRQLTFKDSRRLVLKSPPHTCRIKVLLEMFPEARFIHIVRNPYVVFPSTVNLWKSLYQTHGLQRPTFAGLEDQVFMTFLHLYEKLEEGRKLVGKSQFHELRYEDLTADPVGQMRLLYDRLELGGFDRLLPRLESYLASVSNYQTNKYDLSPDCHRQITDRWAGVIHRYGYDREDAGPANNPPSPDMAPVATNP